MSCMHVAVADAWLIARSLARSHDRSICETDAFAMSCKYVSEVIVQACNNIQLSIG